MRVIKLSKCLILNQILNYNSQIFTVQVILQNYYKFVRKNDLHLIFFDCLTTTGSVKPIFTLFHLLSVTVFMVPIQYTCISGMRR